MLPLRPARLRARQPQIATAVIVGIGRVEAPVEIDRIDIVVDRTVEAHAETPGETETENEATIIVIVEMTDTKKASMDTWNPLSVQHT